MKKIIFITILLLFPLGVFAKDSWQLLENKNKIVLTGTCSGGDVSFSLFSKDSGKEAYSSGVHCENGKFNFTDNLLQWAGMTDGEYTLVVNDDKQNTRDVSLERPSQTDVAPAVDTSADSSISEKNSDDKATDNPETKFLGAFVTLQQSILDMRSWLVQTKYPAFVKSSLGGALDGIDFAVGKLSGYVLDSQNNEQAVQENDNTENIANSSTDSMVSDNAETKQNVPVQTQSQAQSEQ
jgi:hypothetical protein